MLWKAGRGCAIRSWPGPPDRNGLWLLCPAEAACWKRDADLDGICRDLETALPELCRPADGCRCRSARSGASALSGLLRRGQSASLGLSPRKLELRALLAACGLSIVLGFTGNGRAHLLAGTAFGLLAARHVWTRRKAL